jgi:RimJ/RimL family protein N-acetyltransferase
MSIQTERLLLRVPKLADAGRLSLLAGDYDVARMTGTVPHPFSERQAAEWVREVEAGEEGVVFAVIRGEALIGCVGYRPQDAAHAELGYWLGKPFWGKGYATEAVAALIRYAFEIDDFDYLTAGHFDDNSVSARVLAKLGFVRQTEEMRHCAAAEEARRAVIHRLDRAAAARDRLSRFAG